MVARVGRRGVAGPSTAVTVTAWVWPAVCVAEPVRTNRVAAGAPIVTASEVPVGPLPAVAREVPVAALPV